MKRAVIILVILAVIAGGAFAYTRVVAARTPAAATTTTTATVQRGSLTATVNSAGNITSRRTADLAFSTSGVVKQVNVAVGDRVKAGQVLAELDNTDLSLQLRNSEINLKVAQAKLAQTKNPTTAQDLASARSKVESAKASYNSLIAGADKAELAIAQTQVANAQLSYQAAVKAAAAPNTQLQSAAGALEKARIALEQAQSAYDKVSWRPDVGMTSQSSTLQGATIDYEQAKASYEAIAATAGVDSDAKVASARLAVQQAQSNLDKLKNQVSESERISAEAAVQQAENDLQELLAGPDANALDIAQSSVEQSQIALEQMQLKVQQTQLTAPFEGMVTAVNLKLGQTAGTTTIQMADLDHLEIVVNMAEVDVNRIKKGQRAQVTLDALAEARLQGAVSQIALVGVQSQGVVNYPVTIALTNPPAGVKTGMTANLDIIVDERKDVLLVPNRAVRTQGRNKVVTVVAGEQERVTPVQTGLSDETRTEIVSGLQEGELVQVTGTTAVNAAGGRQGNFNVGVPGGRWRACLRRPWSRRPVSREPLWPTGVKA